ncbi:MAG: hypothetical protein ACRC51_00635 [Cetobacterium sp.]
MKIKKKKTEEDIEMCIKIFTRIHQLKNERRIKFKDIALELGVTEQAISSQIQNLLNGRYLPLKTYLLIEKISCEKILKNTFDINDWF